MTFKVKYYIDDVLKLDKQVNCYIFLTSSNLNNTSKDQHIKFILIFNRNEKYDGSSPLKLPISTCLEWIDEVKSMHPNIDKIITNCEVTEQELIVTLESLTGFSNCKYLMLVSTMIRYLSDPCERYEDVIETYFNLKKIKPEFDNISLFAMAHYVLNETCIGNHGIFSPKLGTYKIPKTKALDNYFSKFIHGFATIHGELGNVKTSDITFRTHIKNKNYEEAFKLTDIFENGSNENKTEQNT